MEVWKVRVQTHLTRSYSSTPGNGGKPVSANAKTAAEVAVNQHSMQSVFRSLMRHPAQLLRGSSATLIDNTIGNGIYFGTYESLRIGLGNREQWSWTTEFFVGGLTGVVFKGAMYPVDIVKARMMTDVDGLGMRGVAKKIYAQGGVLGFYRGVSVTVARAFTINSAGWPALRAAQWALGVEDI